MKKISCVLVSILLLVLVSCSDTSDIEEKEAQIERVENEVVEGVTTEIVEGNIESEIVEKGDEAEITQEVTAEDEPVRFLEPGELDGAFAIYDRKEKLFWESQSSTLPESWSSSERWVEPILTEDGYVYTVEQTLLDSPAFEFCSEKGEGWRIPLKSELQALVSNETTNSSGKMTELTSITEDFYWTSEQVGDDNAAWVVDFTTGKTRDDLSGENVYVLCVHDEIDLTGGISDEEFDAENEITD